MGSSPSQAAEAGPGSRARGAGWDAAQPDSGQGVLTIGGGGGGLILGSHVGPGQGLVQFSLLFSNYVDLEPHMKSLRTSPDLFWGPLAPTKQSLPYNFHRNFNPVKIGRAHV